MSDRLQELAALCEERKLTPAELDECFDLSVGAETVRQLEKMMAEQGKEQ